METLYVPYHTFAQYYGALRQLDKDFKAATSPRVSNLFDSASYDFCSFSLESKIASR
jgi:hypothetical protein